MLAGFIILRLRNILGRKTGHQEKPINKYFPKGLEVMKDIENNEAIKTGNIDENTKKQFLKGAEVAYEQIITSFAKGDKKSLKPLLEKEMFNRFSEVIDERKNKQLKSETTFIGFKSIKILEFKKIENIYKVTVNFVSEIITCVKDKNNQIIEGNPDTVKTVNDVWRFAKNMWSQDPTWYLVDTSIISNEIENMVLGIGINFKIKPHELASTIKKTPNFYGVATLVKKNEKALPLVHQFLYELENVFQLINSRRIKKIKSEWTKRSSTIGRNVSIITSEGNVSGKAVKIDSDGALIISNGKKAERILVGDITQ